MRTSGESRFTPGFVAVLLAHFVGRDVTAQLVWQPGKVVHARLEGHKEQSMHQFGRSMYTTFQAVTV